MSQQVITGQTDWSIRLWCYDAAGAAVTGLLHNSAGMAVSVVVRSKGRILSMTALTLVARSSVGVHRDSAWTEVSDGEYVVDLPDSYLATAERTVSLTVAATAITGTVIVETIEVGRGVELDSATQTQLDNIENTAAQRAFGIVERPPSDTGVITFVWPALGATITGTVSLNNASYIPVIGAFEFLRTDGGKYFYTLAYNTADRPVSAGSARYALTDGTYTRYLVLRVVESGDTGETTALAVLCFDWEAVTGEVPSRSVLNALRHIRNKWALDGNTKTVYAEDDTTPAYTTSVTADGAGNIIADTPD